MLLKVFTHFPSGWACLPTGSVWFGGGCGSVDGAGIQAMSLSFIYTRRTWALALCVVTAVCDLSAAVQTLLSAKPQLPGWQNPDPSLRLTSGKGAGSAWHCRVIGWSSWPPSEEGEAHLEVGMVGRSGLENWEKGGYGREEGCLPAQSRMAE